MQLEARRDRLKPASRSDACRRLASAGALQCDVERARYPEPGIHVQKITVGGRALGNDTEVTVAELASGITINCDANPFHGSVLNKPVCFVTLEIPFLWKTAVVGFQPLILACDVNSELKMIFWQAKAETTSWLETWPFKAEKEPIDRLLARLTVKGNFIWSENDPALYLDGEVFGLQTGAQPITAVKFPSGDNRRGGDLEMWFWLIKARVPGEISVTLSLPPPPKDTIVIVNQVLPFSVSVQGGDITKVNLTVNDIPNGGPRVGRVDKDPDAGPGHWTYTAPATIPLTNPVTIRATSQEDSTKFAIAEVEVKESKLPGPPTRRPRRKV